MKEKVKMEALLFTFSMKERRRGVPLCFSPFPPFLNEGKSEGGGSALRFLNEGVDYGGASLLFLNGSTLHFLNEDKCEMFCSSLSPSKNGRVKNGVPYRPILL